MTRQKAPKTARRYVCNLLAIKEVKLHKEGDGLFFEMQEEQVK